jgi:hypothetical protein
MASRSTRTTILVLGITAVGVYLAIRQSRKIADTTGPGQLSPDPFGESDAGKALRHFLSVMYSSGENATDTYRQALESLRADPEKVLDQISQSESLFRETDYPTRWALIFTASELRHPAALPYLRSVALSRIPAERSQDTHSFSTVAEETILRTTAVEGIGHLAHTGNAQAVDALFECLARPSLSVQRAAVQSLLGTPDGQQYRDRIAQSLPDDRRFLLDLHRIDVREAPQVRNPEQFLTDKHSFSSPPPHAREGEPAEGSARLFSGKNRPPTLTRR